MKRIFRIVALVLVIALLLSGCSSTAFQQLLQGLLGRQYIPFSEIEYTRPDMEEFRGQLNSCIQGAQEDTKVKSLMDKVFDLYDTYYRFYTNYKLANIYYYKDMSSSYWEEEYSFCLEYVSEVDAGMDRLLYALAKSSLKPQLEAEEYFGAGYFDAYAGTSLWDETFTQLMAQEMKLQSEYDALSAQAMDVLYFSDAFFDGVGLEMEQLLVELVALRQEIATYAGYDDYLQFAYEFYYDRDYTPTQAAAYMEDIQDQLTPLYAALSSDVWAAKRQSWSEQQTFAYVESAANAMGGTVTEAFSVLKDGGYYDIEYRANKYTGSFETYLQYYYAPFVFVSPANDGTDPLTFAHEFGHFCNDYASSGTICGIDVAEIFSLGTEYVSLFYADGGEALTELAMASSLSIFVEQAAYASFEHQLYSLEGDQLTVENVRALYQQLARAYGFDQWRFDNREYIVLAHLYVAPMYMVSYVVSNDVAMQIYQAEDAQSGKGRDLLMENLATQEISLLAFVESAGFSSPFAEGRAAQLKETFQRVLA